MQRAEESEKYSRLICDTIFQFKNLFLEDKNIKLDFYINYCEFTPEMRKNSCVIQVMYNINHNDTDLIVLYCHLMDYPLPTLTPEELSVIRKVRINVIYEIIGTIDTFYESKSF